MVISRHRIDSKDQIRCFVEFINLTVHMPDFARILWKSAVLSKFESKEKGVIYHVITIEMFDKPNKLRTYIY